MQENDLYQELLAAQEFSVQPETRQPRPVTDYAALVRSETWQQAWDPESRQMGAVHSVTGSIWSDAIASCLQENGCVFIPKTPAPVYIDRPIVLHSGDRLSVHPETEIRLKTGVTGTCMLRNSNIVFSQSSPITPFAGADQGILIEGGIWSDQCNEGHGHGGAYDTEGSMPGSNGMFLLHNISGLTVRNVLFRDCSAFAIQLGNANNFVVENITIDESADGIHIEGPSAHGIIRRISAKTNDDVVALNAWDWDSSSLTFGAITDILVEDVETPSGYTWSELRLLPGTKVFPNGETLACDIRRCIFRDIRGVHTIKMYDQPNLARPEDDFADPIGKMSDLFFADIRVDGIQLSDYYDKSSDAVFDICANIDTLSIRNVRFNYTPGENDMARYLVSVGPKALTWPRGSNPPAEVWVPPVHYQNQARIPLDDWKEVFNPNANPVVTKLQIKDIYLPTPGEAGVYGLCHEIPELINERHLILNPDFPHTLPRGGTGHGRVLDLEVSYDPPQ
jgi:hypothetical protein